MPQKTDLYSVLFSYAKKNQSPRINMETFIFFLEKYSQRVCEDKPEWLIWAKETAPKVWLDVNRLAEEKKIAMADYIIYNNNIQILMPQVMKIHRQLI